MTSIWTVDAHDVEGRFRELGGEIQEFVDAILQAECWRCGIPSSDIDSTPRTLADGGVGTRVASGSSSDGYGYLRVATVWQMRAQPWKATQKALLRKLLTESPYLQERLEAGDALRICVLDAPAARDIESREKLLNDLIASEIGVQTSEATRARLLATDKLATWASRFFGVVKRFVPATLLDAPGIRLLARRRSRGASAPPAWPCLFPRAAEPADRARSLAAELAGFALTLPPWTLLEEARRRLASIEVAPGAFEALGEIGRRLADGSLGAGDGALHRALQTLVAFAAFLGEDEIRAADIDRLLSVFGERGEPRASPQDGSTPASAGLSRPSGEDPGSTISVGMSPTPVPLPAGAAGRRERSGGSRHGRVVRHASPRSRVCSIDLAATLRHALPLQRLRGREPGLPPVITPDDLRIAIRSRKAGTTHFLVLDASGSMAGRAIALGRGIALSILDQSYRTRERVALLSIAHARARLVATPTRAPERLRRLVLAPRAGGATPLPSALALALEWAIRERSRTTVVLVTDGRANVSLDGRHDPGIAASEVSHLLGAVRDAGARVLVAASPRDHDARAFARRHALEVWAVHPLAPIAPPSESIR